MARHRTGGSSLTLNGAMAIPFSTARSTPPSPGEGGAPRIRRPAAVVGSPELDVWLDRDQGPSPTQPSFSFPPVTSSAPPPPPKDHPPSTPPKGGFYKNSSSIAKAKERRAPGTTAQPAKLNWRDKGQDLARLRKKTLGNGSAFSIPQLLAGAGGAALVIFLLVTLSKGRSKSPIVKHMERREQILAATLAPTTSPTTPRALEKHESFRDVLASDARYLISPTHGDFAEQVMNFYTLAHLATVLQRIPIAHPFTLPSPEDSNVLQPVPVSTIFDMPRFSILTSIAALDWHDLRPHELEESGATEPLGCWVGGQLKKEDRKARSRMMKLNGIAPSFVPVRVALAKGPDGEGDDLKATHDFIKRFDSDASAKSGLIDQARHDSSISSSSRRHTNPEQQVFCIDHSLYRPEHPTTRHSTTHLDPRDHTAFFTHGKHLYFAPELHETAGDVVSHLLGHHNPFLAVHISAKARQSECVLLDKPEKCGVDLSDYAHAVDRIRHLVAAATHRKSREQRHSARTLSVVVSTDVKDLGFRGELSNLGWTLLDYDDLEMRERFGAWAPELMDQAIESRASGFVGTRGSSQSTLSALRVRTWRSGSTELV